MKIAIVGAGIVGLTIARTILNDRRKIDIELYDAYSIPSKGTSSRNSGVMHAGLYYEPNSLKAKLCYEGRILMNEYIKDNNLSIKKCGKILVPQNKKDIYNLELIYQNSQKNDCKTELIDFKSASGIQPYIAEREIYLWSPRTFVFNPEEILNTLKRELEERGCEFKLERVIHIDADCGKLKLEGRSKSFDFIYNTAGPEALMLFKGVSNKYDRLELLPFLGEYGVLRKGPEVRTNLYPVPDPKLPFLGVHVTPRCKSMDPIVGPNAVPYFKSYVDEYRKEDMISLPKRASQLTRMIISNKDNFREHALKEITLRTNRKFCKEASKFFSESVGESMTTQMERNIYGIRPQLVDIDSNKLINDFKLEVIGKSAHIVNAVSPAFTSSIALAKYIVSKTLA